MTSNYGGISEPDFYGYHGCAERDDFRGARVRRKDGAGYLLRNVCYLKHCNDLGDEMIETLLILVYCANLLMGLSYFFFGHLNRATFHIAVAIFVRLGFPI